MDDLEEACIVMDRPVTVLSQGRTCCVPWALHEQTTPWALDLWRNSMTAGQARAKSEYDAQYAGVGEYCVQAVVHGT